MSSSESDPVSVAPVLQPPTPCRLGWRMPAEWEPHEASWFSWPQRESPGKPAGCPGLLGVLASMVDALYGSETVCIEVSDSEHEQEAREALRKNRSRIQHVRFFQVPTNTPWCRDHAPVFLTKPGESQPAIVDWDYNANGWKHPPFDLDNAAPASIAGHLGCSTFSPGMVLEGGAVDVNGSGTLLATKACLFNSNRNPDLSEKEIEGRLKDYLGATRVLWLGDGIEGNDSDGHVDCVARFIGRNKVAICVEDDPNDLNYDPLQENLAKLRSMNVEDGSPLEIHPLPMPGKIARNGDRFPASYANFYVANKVVLLPVFRDSADTWAKVVLQSAFSNRKIVGIDCRELIQSRHGLHCLVAQQPVTVKLPSP